MKFIDEKGKIFGFINIIDLAVIIILALIVVGGIKRMQDKPIIVEDSATIEVLYEVSDVRQETVDNLVVGDQIYHYDRGGHIGEIIEVNQKPFKDHIETDEGWIYAEVPERYVAEVIVRTEEGKNSPDVIVIGGEQTRVGGQYRLKNKRISCFGTVLNIDILD